jgi:hypothetical protein
MHYIYTYTCIKSTITVFMSAEPLDNLLLADIFLNVIPKKSSNQTSLIRMVQIDP